MRDFLRNLKKLQKNLEKWIRLSIEVSNCRVEKFFIIRDIAFYDNHIDI